MKIYLKKNIDDDDQEGINQIEEQPLLHWFSGGCAWQWSGDWQVDWGQDHHDGDVDGEDQVILTVSANIYRRLVDTIHQKWR